MKRRVPARRRQRGMVLIAVLVVLMLTLLGGIGVMQAVQTGNAMAGNFAFRQAAMQASDRAVSDAMTQLANRVPGGLGNTAVPNLYLPTIGAVDATGVPTSVTWSTVPCVDERGALVSNCGTDSGNYRVQYVIERRCSAAPDFANIASIRAVCEYEPRDSAVSAATIALRYRVVIRVRGPRGTESLFEAVVSGPAST